MEIKDKIMAFAWEPVGSKFAIVTSVSNNNNNVSFYCVKSGTEPALLSKSADIRVILSLDH